MALMVGSGAILATEIIGCYGLVAVSEPGEVPIWLNGLVAVQIMLRKSLVVEVLCLFWLRGQC